MKKIYFLLLTLIITSLSFGQSSDLYISMVAEGSSNNKFIEIYNGTGADINLIDYAFPSTSNAPSEPGEYEYWNTFIADAVVANGDVFVIAHGSADATILAQADMTHNYLSNGDDGYALVKNDGSWSDTDGDGVIQDTEITGYTILDFIGDFEADPGSAWAVAGVTIGTKDHTLTRKSTVCGPNNDWTASAGTTAENSEWLVGAIDTGWNELGAYNGCVTGPVLSVTNPSNNQEFDSGTTSVTLSVSVDNFEVDATPANGGNGDGHIHWTLDGVDQSMKYDTADETINVVDGGSHTVTMTLVDNTHTPLSPTINQTVSFSVAFPCNLQVGTITTTCDDSTSNIDNYTTEILFSGGGTSNYTLSTTDGVGTISGDDPSTMESGTIIITNVNEGVSFSVSFLGETSNSNCDFTRSITSPSCVGTVTCANVGDIIITEVMQNPSAVGDNAGEYFEVYNTTDTAIDMQGWVIKDETSESETHIISNLTVAANSYAVLGLNSNSSLNGGYIANYQYNTISLGNGTDGVILECSETIIDQVIWDDGTTFPDPAGKSMELNINSYTNTDNDLGTNWAESTQTFGDGDFGTPGSQNTFSAENLLFQNIFSIYPNPSNIGYVNITSTGSETIQAKVYDILGKQVINAAVASGRLDVSTLNTGVYIVKLTQGTATTTKKLIVQ